MNKVAENAGDIARELAPKLEEVAKDEEFVIVAKGPDMTPKMEALISGALVDLLRRGVDAKMSDDLAGAEEAVRDTVRFIRTQYLGTNPAMLANYEAAQLAKDEGRLLEGGE